ncbi:ROK family protein [Solitalea canadensis]|uniref:Transcriptional regulator/sugar kinase n=1 Tax=Solitalea canadensis (strain ATCC 29591 / DSM 3403 / JCM 21819 / LMG 8368 / NBRC 15130 / NCIMB 12057 / USAM 9D) TaxID=929556 RepID=H8KRV3_SOLCM|nr:ROK family protein [Solitalea canadensis]AFD07741.1 transcriptional regulator/sugar kinase [Solitalea canadensis DSM 3403]
MIAANTFFEELHNENISGVAYKNLDLKKKTIAHFATIGNATIADLCKELNSSAPKVTTLINELIKDNLVQDYGKIDSTGGRRPNLYGLAPEAGFFLGVEVRKYHINIGLIDIKKNLVKLSEKIPYRLNNSQESLDELCNVIQHFINELPISKDKILGMGINLSGRINFATGYSYSYFYFNEEPLNKVIEARIGIKTLLENDSRAMAYGEFCSGAVNEEKNVLFINLDYGIGMGVLINGQLYYGKSGYSGEFGHIPFFNNEIICHCGKKGCLETETSGEALVRMFQKKLQEGSSSIATVTKAPEEIQLEDILQAAINDDVLSIELLAEIGEKIGRGIALLINIFNPELVIIGGSISSTGNYIQLPIRSALNKYSLSLVNNDTQLKLSKLGSKAGIMGASLLARNKILSLN